MKSPKLEKVLEAIGNGLWITGFLLFVFSTTSGGFFYYPIQLFSQLVDWESQSIWHLLASTATGFLLIAVGMKIVTWEERRNDNDTRS